jgi:hypothetical protein
MANTSLAQIPAKLYDLLAPLTPEDRLRVVQATLVLFGEEIPVEASLGPKKSSLARPAETAGAPSDPAAFISQKDPQNKGELLAVAARYRELIEKADSHSKADLRKVITDAHRNFDDTNFARDLNNAKRQAGFFVLGAGRNAHKLSYYGKQYVDALPHREAAAGLKRPKIGGGRKGSSKKKTKR